MCRDRMPIKDKAKYNEYMRNYMKRYKLEIEDRKQQELETALDVARFPINAENGDDCKRFRLLVLGLAPQDANPFEKANHLSRSTKGRTTCKSCKPFCRCFEWYQNHKPIRGCRIWG